MKRVVTLVGFMMLAAWVLPLVGCGGNSKDLPVDHSNDDKKVSGKAGDSGSPKQGGVQPPPP